MDRINETKSLFGIRDLTLRSLLLGMAGSAIITASSMYVALRISALPWPIIFVTVLSMSVLKAMGKTSHSEINVAQTGMSAGSMVAGGLAFTLPGMWIVGQWSAEDGIAAHFWMVVGIAMAGMLLGTVMTYLLRNRYVVTEKLPYPIGEAAAQTIVTGDSGGRKSILLYVSMGFSVVFTALRDQFAVIPQVIHFAWLYSKNIYADIWLSPMAAGLGYMIGWLYTFVWFLGAVLGYFVLIPIGVAVGIFETPEAASAVKDVIGIGLMVGTGFGILLKFIWDRLKTVGRGRAGEKFSINAFFASHYPEVIAVCAAFVLTVILGLHPVAAVLLMALVFVAASMAAILTGQTGINPMEILGIIVLLIIRLVVQVDTAGAFLIAAVVAVACGYGGDMLNDFKAGHTLGTNPKAQLISQLAGGVVGVFVSALALLALVEQFGGFGQEYGLPAFQAFAVSSLVEGVSNPTVFYIAAAVGAILYLLRIPALTLGIGIYLSFSISAIVFIGGLIRLITDRLRPKSEETGTAVASGLFGGEGITGVALAIIRMVTGG